MIYFDVTKAGGAGHRSGLMRVSARLADGLRRVATEVRWPTWDRATLRADDWFSPESCFQRKNGRGLRPFGETRRTDGGDFS